MAASRACTGLVLAFLAGTAGGAAAQAVPPATPAQPPAQPAAPAQPPAQQNDGASTRLGRSYPAPATPPTPRQHPDFSVSVVSPQGSGIHEHAERQQVQDSLRDKRGFGSGSSMTPAPGSQ